MAPWSGGGRGEMEKEERKKIEEEGTGEPLCGVQQYVGGGTTCQL